MFTHEKTRLIYTYDGEILWIEPWGENSLRVRATKKSGMPMEDWALAGRDAERMASANPGSEAACVIEAHGKGCRIRNGKITAEILEDGKLIFCNAEGKILLEEYVRNRNNLHAPYCSALKVEAREFKPITGGDYRLSVRFESDPGEKIFGMGQYQQECLNLKGTDLELAHRNSQASVPFAVSSLGYGFLWNNPAVGRVVFGNNLTTWEAYSTDKLDYWITAGDTPAEITEAYASVTGTVPMMPDYAMGFWQCKLRYQTQEELLSVAREYKKRNLPIDVIVVDFFHWTEQGDWKFDPVYWPDPEAMVRELKEMGIELMVSIWPTVSSKSENYQKMREMGYLIHAERGCQIAMQSPENVVYYDATHPGAREYVWNRAKENYYDKGIRIFWLDEAEPEYTAYDFENYRYHLGSDIRIGNIYPVMYAKTFFDGMKHEGQENIINLIRCAWAGSQKYGALVWSGDIASNFITLRRQVCAGLNMGIAGIPWWTTDIGGFHGGNPDDCDFRELLIRWFEYGTFCPVMRLHGDRLPKKPPLGSAGSAKVASGTDNEVWSFGEEAYEICRKYLNIRRDMKPYIAETMQEAHEKGSPVMRTLFYEFPQDAKAWEIKDEYMFGHRYLVAPVLYGQMRERTVYLPLGSTWTDFWTGEKHSGGSTITVSAPLDTIPVFIRE